MKDTKKAPAGQFRVIGTDNPQDAGWTQGDYPTLSEARQVDPCGHSTIRFQVYDDKGEVVEIIE